MEAARDGTLIKLLFRQAAIQYIALPFSAHLLQTALVSFVIPAGYALDDCLEALRDAKLSLLVPNGPAYRCKLDAAQRSDDRVSGRHRVFGLISTPLPPFADLPKDTAVLLEDRDGTTRLFPFDSLRKTG